MQIRQFWIYLHNQFPEVEIRHINGSPYLMEGEEIECYLDGHIIFSGDWIKTNEDGTKEIIREKDYNA